MKTETFRVGVKFESNTTYLADRTVYDIQPSDDFEEIHCWWSFRNSGNIPLRAAFVLRDLENVTIDLQGAKLVFHGRMMPFAVYSCKNISFKNFSIDYDRPFYTQGTVLRCENNSVTIRIPESFGYRVEGHDFIAVAEHWEHRTVEGDMLIICMDPKTGRPSFASNFILGLIGDRIEPRPNPPIPVHHLLAEDLGDRTVKISNLPSDFVPRVGEILTMTHEDRRKTGFLLEEDTDTSFENIRLIHIGAMGTIANRCHNLYFNNFSMYLDGETGDRIVTINADSIHCFHCTGKITVEHCRFENMLDDALNIHGNYLVSTERIDGHTLKLQSRASDLTDMPYAGAGDKIAIHKGNTQEISQTLTVASAEYCDKADKTLAISFVEPLAPDIVSGDVAEILSTPELEIRDCRMKGINGVRVSTDRRTLIENCHFENHWFSVLFSGDTTYWYESGPVRDVEIRNCTFVRCGTPVQTDTHFTPTEKEPYFHKNIRFVGNTVIAPREGVMRFSNVEHILYENNTVTELREGLMPIVLNDCGDVTVR